MTNCTRKLRDIGTFGDDIRIFECAACETRYPCATWMDSRGQSIPMQKTPGPMMNGQEVHDCPCKFSVCSACKGEGYQGEDVCDKCNGEGRVYFPNEV